MKSGSWQTQVVLVALGVVAIGAAVYYTPQAAFSYRKQLCLSELRESINADAPRLAPGIRRIEPAREAGEAVTASVDGYEFAMPKAVYEVSAGLCKPILFTSPALTVRIDGVRDKRPEFKPGFGPSDPEVARFFREADPHEILLAAFNSAPADVKHASTTRQLQKSLYLLLLRAALQTHGAEDLWQRIEVHGRPGFLSGDPSSQILVATIYLRDSKRFAEVVITASAGVSMAEIYACLASLQVKPVPAGDRLALPGFLP